MLKPIEASYNLKLIGPMCRNAALCARHVQLLLINYAGGVAEDADVDIQPITRVDFVPAKVFRSRSMNTHPACVVSRRELLGVKTWLSTLEIVNLSVFRMRQ